jgi:hypothetical protein
VLTKVLIKIVTLSTMRFADEVEIFGSGNHGTYSEVFGAIFCAARERDKEGLIMTSFLSAALGPIIKSLRLILIQASSQIIGFHNVTERGYAISRHVVLRMKSSKYIYAPFCTYSGRECNETALRKSELLRIGAAYQKR